MSRENLIVLGFGVQILEFKRYNARLGVPLARPLETLLSDIHTQSFSNKGKTETDETGSPTSAQVLDDRIIYEVSKKLKQTTTH